MPTQTFQVQGSYGLQVGVQYARIVHAFGDGYTSKALVGNSDGERFFDLNLEFLPDDGSLTVVDPENGSAVTNWPAYVFRFFERRMVDGAAFNFTYHDPDTGASTTALVDLVENSLAYTYENYRLFSARMQFRQART